MMNKKPVLSPNANLPPIVVLENFLVEKKRDFVSQKLFDFGLVRKEIFDPKLGHKKKDFKYKKLFGKRYRYSPAPMTDAEVDKLFNLIQPLLMMTPKSNQEPNNSTLANGEPAIQKRTMRFSILGSVMIALGFLGLAGGGYGAYLVYTNNGSLALELAAVIGGSSILFFFTLIALARILRFVRA